MTPGLPRRPAHRERRSRWGTIEDLPPAPSRPEQQSEGRPRHLTGPRALRAREGEATLGRGGSEESAATCRQRRERTPGQRLSSGKKPDKMRPPREKQRSARSAQEHPVVGARFARSRPSVPAPPTGGHHGNGGGRCREPRGDRRGAVRCGPRSSGTAQWLPAGSSAAPTVRGPAERASGPLPRPQRRGRGARGGQTRHPPPGKRPRPARPAGPGAGS